MSINLDKVGPLLKAAREKKGVSFDEIAQALFIRKRLIEAIESGNWAILPHALYVKAFVIQYASFLNVRTLVQLEIDSKEDSVPQQEQNNLAESIPHREVIISNKNKFLAGFSVAASILNTRIF